MEWLQTLIQSYLPYISENRLIQASLIFLLASILSVTVKYIIHRLQILGTNRTSNLIDDQFFLVIKKPLSISILLVGIHLAVVRSQLFSEQINIINSCLQTIAVLYWVGAIVAFSRFALNLISRNENQLKIVQKHTLPLFENLAIIVSYGGGVYFFFLAWDIDVTAWVASAGILGLALSFAAKDTLANLFAGVFILADSPYKIGDYIVLDSGERGCVTHIGIRSTRILTRSDEEINIPNAIMGNTKVTNETAGPHSKYRIRIKVGVAYGSDTQKVRKALLSSIENVDGIETDPEPRVRFRTFGDSCLNFELLCWISEPVLRGRVSDELNEAIYNIFNQQEIKIPFPQRDVNLRQIP